MSAQSKAVKDFFISYTSRDRAFAEWIAWCLEQASYTVTIQAWDFPPGSNFVYEMDKALKEAQRVVAVLSPAYLTSEYAFTEWAVAFRGDPQGKERLLLPVRVDECRIEGLLGPIVYCDLVGCDERVAQERLLAAAQGKQAHPVNVPFPGVSHPTMDHPRFPGSLPPIWNVPYPRNAVFTGQEEILARIQSQLQTGQAMALSQAQAISGLGGIGKTQIAVEYAYQHRQDYETVLWVLSDTRESLVSGYIAVAKLLNLPEENAQDQAVIIEAVKNWLQTHGSWLLILDNADDLAMVREFVPSVFGGHLLLTTRAWAMVKLAKRVEVETMTLDTGALLLLRLVGLVEQHASLESASADDVTTARAICEELGGLPLAIDQAGAFIEESQCSLQDYLERYRTRRAVLLQRRGEGVADHPEPVATTWSLSFEKVERKSTVAADLLRLCAFLHPDAIPVELIIKGASHLGPSLASVSEDEIALDDAIAIVGAYSLVRRDASEKTLSVHRLVQAVLRDAMDEPTRKEWAERAVLAVHTVFPSVSFATWSQCERYLPHALVCAGQISQGGLRLTEAAEILRRAGWYLTDRARYSEAEPLLEQAYQMIQEVQGETHLDTATNAHTLAYLYNAQGKYSEAEPLYQRALRIFEQALGAEHPDTGTTLHALASLYQAQGKYEMALPLYQRALRISEQALGAEHPSTGMTLHALASLYQAQGKYEQAESLYQRALRISEQSEGAEHPSTAATLHQLGYLYKAQGKYSEAEPVRSVCAKP